MDESAFLRVGGDFLLSAERAQTDFGRIAPLYEVVDAALNPIGAGYGELSYELDREAEVLWCKQRHTERPSFTPNLLRDVQAFEQRVKARYPGVEAPPFRYLVRASELPDVFNLGGDLDLIYQLVNRQS